MKLQLEGKSLLWTSNFSALNKESKKIPYYIVAQNGNDVVVPDQSDLNEYKKGVITWKAFKLNYLSKLMRPESEKWMKKVANESITEDVVLVSDEKNVNQYYRVMLAEMIVNMFSGHMKISYNGELGEK